MTVDTENKEALRDLLLFLAKHPELVETLIIKPNKVVKQGTDKRK